MTRQTFGVPGTLGVLVLLFYVVTLAKLGPDVLQRPM